VPRARRSAHRGRRSASPGRTRFPLDTALRSVRVQDDRMVRSSGCRGTRVARRWSTPVAVPRRPRSRP
jgi:hypothetical protein